MKTKLTVTIDEDLVPKAKKRAKMEGLSLSRLIERALRKLTAEGEPTFSQRWRGRFRPAARKGERYSALSRKYR
ncbi:MAG: DUF6364 family protein [Planctomycetota bacterium]